MWCGTIALMEENLSEKLHTAIANVLGEHAGTLVNKWVLVVESVQDEGRMCAYISSEGLMTWEVIGMAEATSEYARAQLTLDYMSMVDDDEEDNE